MKVVHRITCRNKMAEYDENKVDESEEASICQVHASFSHDWRVVQCVGQDREEDHGERNW